MIHLDILHITILYLALQNVVIRYYIFFCAVIDKNYAFMLVPNKIISYPRVALRLILHTLSYTIILLRSYINSSKIIMIVLYLLNTTRLIS